MIVEIGGVGAFGAGGGIDALLAGKYTEGALFGGGVRIIAN